MEAIGGLFLPVLSELNQSPEVVGEALIRHMLSLGLEALAFGSNRRKLLMSGKVDGKMPHVGGVRGSGIIATRN